MLRAVDWQLVTDVLGQTVDPISKVEATQDCFTNCQPTLCNVPEEQRPRIRYGSSLKPHIFSSALALSLTSAARQRARATSY